ncbi:MULTISPECIES: hypothetical protein [Pseudomonas]|uniref:Uncharacterized protein n=1 Tax=Pseudomonas oryzihabitans TaxID=47885 RepID=A0A178L6F9_9PSED|nr:MULTISPECIES: hypothetical protein [Pseudomonas]KXJ32151.1 hypothetical protein AX284_01660 [Pseudomonas sp. HUK17]OAN25120.1 hypothetical protein A4V15_23625 [Pseudomonas oryzihabitans]
MFLVYFTRNHFYPSFDLFQFSSLLLAAACLGFLTIGAFVAALFLPGAWVYYRFINTAAIKEDITYALPYRGEGRFRKILLLMALVFFVPYLLAGFSDAAILFVDPELFLSVSLLAPIPITLLTGSIVQWLFELRRFSFLKFVWRHIFPLWWWATSSSGCWCRPIPWWKAGHLSRSGQRSVPRPSPLPSSRPLHPWCSSRVGRRR